LELSGKIGIPPKEIQFANLDEQYQIPFRKIINIRVEVKYFRFKLYLPFGGGSIYHIDFMHMKYLLKKVLFMQVTPAEAFPISRTSLMMVNSQNCFRDLFCLVSKISLQIKIFFNSRIFFEKKVLFKKQSKDHLRRLS
jgi:hypothetical protein